ncbi:BPSS1780 family membrane protein [Parachitinimonas caeni]|uniref:BPSS1780 family membrane protein n=1 Tax=Parachitinimonas caeni TaxID=3031301 RepID=A0ABT7DRJ3_9NEIS|nr:BPSS1780 family membrane protein [Parachitinimonas caeni]MDK2122687.1 BPSS1780 family membrane protein [Parachitinimonas caeni]
MQQDSGGKVHYHVAGADAGWKWLTDGFTLFSRNIGVWIGIAVLYGVAYFAISLVGLSLVVYLVAPAIAAGMMLGCRDQEEGRPLEVNHLFKGFQSPQFGSLLALGALTLGFTILVIVVAVILAVIILGSSLITALMADQGANVWSQFDTTKTIIFVMVELLVVMTGLLLVGLAGWLAPCMVIFDNMNPIEALRHSLIIGLKNWLPLTVFGLVVTILAIAASIPLMLGWLVLTPVLWCATYTAWRDIGQIRRG